MRGAAYFRFPRAYGKVVGMSVRMRHTSSHTKNRRSHHALSSATLIKDEEAGTIRKPHRLDEATGMYRGKQIIPQAELDRRTKRAEAAARRGESAPVEGMPLAQTPAHAEQDSAKAEPKVKEGLIGRMTKGKAKARSGFGGGA